MIELERKRLVLSNSKEGVKVNLGYPVYVIKIYRIFINVAIDHMNSINQDEFRYLMLKICSRNSVNDKSKIDYISIFAPGLCTSTSGLINIDRSFPIENVGVSRNTNTPFDELTFTLTSKHEIPESIEVIVEFDTRPGGYNRLEGYKTNLIPPKKEKV